MKGKSLKSKDLTYYTFQLIRKPVKFYLHRRFNLKLIRNEALDDKGPFLLIGNHVTAFDPIIALVYFKPLIKWVAADANFENKLKRFFMKVARVIPITKRYADMRSIRQLMKEVKAGNAVGLFPEGGRTWCGKSEEVIKSTAKLIKFLGVKVYCQKLKGAYISDSRWSKTNHKGRVDIEIDLMLTSEEIKNMSPAEIDEVLNHKLYHNDYDYQKKRMVKLSGNDRAEYIERVIYVCPNCKSIHSFFSAGDFFTCKNCFAQGKINEYGFIEGDFPYDNLVIWNKFQKEYLFTHLNNNEIEPIKLLDVAYKFKKEQEKKATLINFFLNPQNIIIEDKGTFKKIAYNQISEASITFKNTLIFYENKVRHEFVIEPFLHNNASIVYIKEIINYLRNNREGKLDI